MLPINRGEPERLYLAASQMSDEDRAELKLRAEFYISGFTIGETAGQAHPDWRVLFSRSPLLVFGPRSDFLNWLILHRPGTFDLDFRRNPLDGWAWTELANYLKKKPIRFKPVRHRFQKKVFALKSDGREKCYVFGTGPSLEKAWECDWSDGYRIVCNTIVRDPALWEHISPDFIVAGDAIYHFGFSRFARAFRRDLYERLKASGTFFVYPAQFHTIVSLEFSEFEERLIPIPSGWHWDISVDLTRTFRLPNLGNVLPLLLLPLACTLAKYVYLLGFDGRAPDDKLFWSNSHRHTYPEHMEELRKAHPRFFEYYVPVLDPNKYVREYQGDQLDLALEHAERKGWRFEMLHPSWTPALQKRYSGA